MKNTSALLLFGFLTLCTAGGAYAAVSSSVDPQPALRLVTAAITIDGQVVLRASTSDDGTPDADEVWDYLARGLEFQPTEAFSALGIAPTAQTASFGWLKSKDNEHLGEPPVMELHIRYGGDDRPFLMDLERTEDGWRVSRETVEKRFSYRRITRRQAAQLDEPKRSK